MSYPEFMQRRSTRPGCAIIEETDLYKLPGARTTTPGNNNNNNDEAADEQAPSSSPINTRTLRCVKDIWQAAIEGDVECLEANLSLGANLAQLGQPIASGVSEGNNNSKSNSTQSAGGASVQIWGPLFDRCALFRATPLQYACAYNRIEAVQFLLSKGASWEQLSSTGVSAKDYARRRGYVEVLALIEEAERARKAGVQ